MKTGELIADLFGKAGIDMTEESLKAVLSIGIEIDDAVATRVQKSLFNLELAKSMPELKKHFVTPFAAGVDQDMVELLEAAGRQDILDKVKDVKMLGQRMRAVVTELNATKPADKDNESATLKALKEQNDKLLKDLQTKDTTFEEKERTLLNQFEQERVNDAMMSKFDSLSWSDTIPAIVRRDIAKKLLDAELSSKKATVKKGEDGAFQLINTETNVAVLDEKNHVVTLDGLIGNIMTTNKLIKVSEGIAAVVGGSHPAQAFQRVVIPDNGTAKTRPVLSAIDRAMSDQVYE